MFHFDPDVNETTIFFHNSPDNCLNEFKYSEVWSIWFSYVMLEDEKTKDCKVAIQNKLVTWNGLKINGNIQDQFKDCFERITIIVITNKCNGR